MRLKIMAALLAPLLLTGLSSVPEPSRAAFDTTIATEARPVVTDRDRQPQCIGRTGWYFQRVSGPTRVYRQAQRLTTAWAKATHYTWTQARSVTAQLSANVGVSASTVSSQVGVTYSYQASWSTAVQIPANSTRYSQLALYSYYNRYYVKGYYWSCGVRSGAFAPRYTYIYSPIHKSQYLVVVYQ